MKRYSSDSLEEEEEEEEDGLREVSMMEPTKRSSCSTIEQSSTLTSLMPKRHKPDLSISTKDRKDKVGEKIVALQQIVSPYGKTDTASVLLETSEYIRFLHEQVQVLSAPYLESIPATSKMQVQDLDTMYSLRNRGLCLVPISWTVGIARTNGADIWAPIKSSSSTSPRPEKPLSHYFN